MRRRAMAGAGAAVGSLTAATALVLGSVTGHAQAGTSEAYAISAAGFIDIDPTPHAVSDDGTKHETDILSVEEPGLGISAEVGPSMARNNIADTAITRATVGDEVGGRFIPLDELGLLPDGLLPAEAEGEPLLVVDAMNVRCENQAGTVAAENIKVFGERIDDHLGLPVREIGPNFTLELGVATITFNKQFVDDDDRFTIQGLVIEVLPEDQLPGQILDKLDKEVIKALELPEMRQEIVVGSATCSQAIVDDEPEKPEEPEDEPEKPEDDRPTAPKPTPTETELPVTG
ncbi:hypothetical protein [Haloechinothrix sp. LS1_15]|uniref:hypothetical protein n=1 Tax=Haloechinothrix sp. LS1_15 TaxID=2652248 RepID=UPI0029442900|nr:hypothetical protein [Haloechinothrix sp. LS1_15]MDV6014553.1 hypothetical protein [Haloechinothrix sp. LS1_15]